MTATTAQAETVHEDRLPGRWLVLAVVCLAQLVVVLDNTVLNVAVPTSRAFVAGGASKLPPTF